MRAVKQSTARNVMVFMTDSADHVTGKTGLTLTLTASKNGAAFASITPTVTERGSGWYNLALTAGNLDTIGDFVVHATGSGADPADLAFEVVAYDPADAAGLGLSRLDAAISTRSTLTQANILSDATPFQGARIDASISSRAPESGGNLATLLARVLGTIAAGTHSPQSGDAYARLGAPSGASIAADILTRLATAGYTAPDNAGITAIKAKTDNLPSDPADESLLEAAIATRLAAASYTAPDNSGIADAKAAAEAVNARLPADPSEAGDAMTLTAAAVDSILDEVIEGALTLRQALRIVLSGVAGKASGAPSGPIRYRDLADSKDRIVGTIDSDGNRTAVTLDGA